MTYANMVLSGDFIQLSDKTSEIQLEAGNKPLVVKREIYGVM